MKQFATLFIIALWVTAGFVIFALRQSADTPIPYPEGFREWVHVKSALIGEESPAFKKFGGIHHIYANPKAVEGFKSGRFPDGSVIVFDQLDVVVEKGVTSDGPRRFIDVMHKDSAKFAKTGGWGFEEFKGDSTTELVLTAEAAAKCFECHTSQKDRGYVFSSLRK